ncbi:Hint domain-containing protein [Celeribacter sp.]|uniref:Hint domain-containing protein n=1 Tax=Celeribacter sp. TaxID=1890673 RepID=UPI003A8FF10B
METGSLSTFVIAWSQIEVDGLETAPLSALTIGATWRWSGNAVCVDGPRDVLLLDHAIGHNELHQRAARKVRRLIGTAADGAGGGFHGSRDRLFDGGFDITDGVTRYEMTVIDTPVLGVPLVMCLGAMPPVDTDLWVISSHVATAPEAREAKAGGVICFTPGTRIMTPDGARFVEDLREGDFVQTKDDGAQRLAWIGGRRITGARLYAMPELRPVRVRARALGAGSAGGAFCGGDVPDGDLIVSPQHRFLLGGAAARDLFAADEVLVAARDLVNDRSVIVDRSLRELTYIHLMFDRHQVVFANGLETESFHPAFTDLDDLAMDQRHRLIEAFPDLASYTDAYGPAARRTLSSAEAAILLHAAA